MKSDFSFGLDSKNSWERLPMGTALSMGYMPQYFPGENNSCSVTFISKTSNLYVDLKLTMTVLDTQALISLILLVVFDANFAFLEVTQVRKFYTDDRHQRSPERTLLTCWSLLPVTPPLRFSLGAATAPIRPTGFRFHV